MPLSQAVGLLSPQVGLPIDAGTFADRVVSFRAEGEPADAVLSSLAARVGASIRWGSVIRFVDPSTDELVVVPRGGLEAGQITEVGKAFADEGVRVIPIGNRVMLSGREGDASRMATLLGLVSEDAEVFTAQVRVHRVDESVFNQIGLRVDPSFNLRAGFDAGIDTWTPLLRGSALVDVLGTLTHRSSAAAVVIDTPTVLLDGEQAVVKAVDRIPVPRRTVSDQGTVTTVGFDFIDAGITVTLLPVRVSQGLRVKYSVDVSRTSSFVEGAPVVTRAGAEGHGLVVDSEWQVLAALRNVATAKSEAGSALGVVPFGRTGVDEDTRSVVVVSLRIDRRSINPAGGGVPSPGGGPPVLGGGAGPARREIEGPPPTPPLSLVTQPRVDN